MMGMTGIAMNPMMMGGMNPAMAMRNMGMQSSMMHHPAYQAGMAGGSLSGPINPAAGYIDSPAVFAGNGGNGPGPEDGVEFWKPCAYFICFVFMGLTNWAFCLVPRSGGHAPYGFGNLWDEWRHPHYAVNGKGVYGCDQMNGPSCMSGTLSCFLGRLLYTNECVFFLQGPGHLQVPAFQPQ